MAEGEIGHHSVAEWGRWVDELEREDLPERMQEVETGLAALPAEVVGRVSSPGAFGSWFLAFRFGPHLFRVVFDGKDPACILERRTRTALGDEWQPTAWQRIGPAAVVFPVEDLLAAVRREAASRD